MLDRFRHRYLVLALALFAGLILAAGVCLYTWLLADLPSLDDLHSYSATSSSKVYDRHGRLLFEMLPPHTGRHSPVPLAEMPKALRQATIATEDATFYENPGVDAWAIARALWINLRGGEVLSGGSTITQQLARNLLMSPEERYERTLTRKMREAVLASRIAQRYSKDQILELYLNEIYFGNLAYGVEAAAQAYFGKNVRDLDLAECAMLAGLPQAPVLYNPLEDQKAAKERQAVVLDLMTRHGYITAERALLAREEVLHFASSRYPIRAPHFVMYVRGLLEQALGLELLERGGLEIHTTLDLDLNETARDLVRTRLERLAECGGDKTGCPPGGHNVRNAALVAMDPLSGEILAMLGSPDYFSAEIDGAVNGTTALRQPGSSIKPITYAAAFEKSALTPATMMLDVRGSFVTREGTPYVPLNYDLQFRGPVRLREALASSYNLVAVKVLDTIGIETMTAMARRLGITTFDDPDRLGLSVTLGGGEVRLLELTGTYGAFANGGYVVQPVAILRVEDGDGDMLLGPLPGGASFGEGHRQAIDPRLAYLITDILSDEVARLPSFGEGSALELSRPAAVKTGTTTDYRDNWTIGYTPDLVVGVWVGNADNEPMREVTGISGAAPIWNDLMEVAVKGTLARQFERPEGMSDVEVCALSGHLPGKYCPHRVMELFIEGSEPTETCDMHQRVAIDRATGLQATNSTPEEQIVYTTYTILPPEAQEWARDQGMPEPPPVVERQVVSSTQQLAWFGGDEASGLVMTSPDQGAAYRLDQALPRDAQRILVSVRPGVGASLAGVTLLVDGQPWAHVGAPPYEALWPLEPGTHVFSAEGLASSGAELRSDEVWVTVQE